MAPPVLSVPAGYRLVSVAAEPTLWEPAGDMTSASWPMFMKQDPVADRCWPHLSAEWADLQLVLLDQGDQVAAVSQAAPLAWDGTDEGLPLGWDDQFERSVDGLTAGRRPDTLGAIQINVARRCRGQGLSSFMLEAMKQAAVEAGLTAVIACVRPTEKSRYPLLPIETYAAWRRSDGLPVDAWLRVHVRAGGRMVRPSPRSMTIEGSIADWEDWTGLSFPASGPYVVDGALVPVEIDLAADRGVYHDPNVWIVHEVGATAVSSP